MRDLFDKETHLKAYKTMKYVETKMLQMFDNNEKNPTMEAVYVSLC